MKFQAHLTFDGECEAAFRFYAGCFGGTIVTMLTYGQSPMASEVPPEWHGKILHATLAVDGETLAGVDLLPGSYHRPQGYFVILELSGVVEAETIFAALSEGGSVLMPLQPTFWAERFGVVTDRFGTPWEINCGAPPP